MRRLWLPGLLLWLVLPAQADSIGAWTTGVTNDGGAVYAATVNDSGSLLGQYCFPGEGGCIWFLGMGTSCEEGARYPVLANSDSGATHISVYCSAQVENGLYRYVFTEFDAIDELVKKASRVGFAVPLQSDNFKVIRFDLVGSNRALEVLATAVAKLQESAKTKPSPTRQPRSTRDQFM